MTEKEVLQRQVLEGRALEELQHCSGWQKVLEIFQDLYNEALARLVEKEDMEARATLKSLQEIVDRIDLKIKLGKEAGKELERQIKKMQSTE